MTSAFRALSNAVFLTFVGGGAATLDAQTTLRGKVVDSEIGSGIAGATVRVGKDGQAITTDSLGRFILTGLRKGTAEVLIMAIGYDSSTFEVPIRDSGRGARGLPPAFQRALRAPT